MQRNLPPSHAPDMGEMWVLVEEILRRLPAKYLHCVRAVATRYNLIVLSPGFVARYW